MKKIEQTAQNKVDIEYDGKYPNFCAGNLVVTIKQTLPTFELENNSLSAGQNQVFVYIYKFPKFCLESVEYVRERKIMWTIAEWPKNFPNVFKEIVLDELNRKIPQGCCGGCKYPRSRAIL